MFESHEESYELEVPLPLGARGNDLAPSPSDAEWAVDVAAAYLLQQVQSGHAHVRIAASLIARATPDPDLALAHLEATRRTLELVAFYVSNVELACNSARVVVTARNQLSKEHRGTLRELRNLRERRTPRATTLEHPAFV